MQSNVNLDTVTMRLATADWLDGDATLEVWSVCGADAVATLAPPIVQAYVMRHAADPTATEYVAAVQAWGEAAANTTAENLRKASDAISAATARFQSRPIRPELL